MLQRPHSRHTSVMATQLAALSNEIAAAVAQAARNVVAVHARPRFSSSGVFWRPGVIVTAEHTIRREEEITVTLPDGTNVPTSNYIAVVAFFWSNFSMAEAEPVSRT